MSRFTAPAPVTLLVAVTMAMAACGSAVTTTTAPAASSPAAISLGEADNGRTIAVSPGQRLTITLHSTYWQVQSSSDPRVATLVEAPAVAPLISGCVPGGGCGTVTAVFVVFGPGRATLSATRTVCGEALRCVPAQQFSVTLQAS